MLTFMIINILHYMKFFYSNHLADPNFEKCQIFLFSKSNSQFYTFFHGEQYPKFLPIYENTSINFKCLNSTRSQKPKTILLWNKFKGLPLLPGLEDLIIKKQTNNVFKDFKCPVSNCKLTFDKSKLNESDMILFHLRNKLDEYPKLRRANQHWVSMIL